MTIVISTNESTKMLKNILFFDTETTGLSHPKKPDTAPEQPMPIQLGYILDDHNRLDRCRVNMMLRPEGWEMGQKARDITGLDEDMATRLGAHFISGMETFLDMIDNSNMCVAHNINYDVVVVRRATYVYCEMMGIPYEDPFGGKEMFCTMLGSMDIVKALPKKFGRYKWPNLTECVRFFFDEELQGAHDALNDVDATRRVFYHLMDNYAGELKAA